MRQRRLGRSGLRVSRLGLGTMTWGRDTDEHEAREQLEAFLQAGGTLVDTAASYAGGDSERVLGKLLAGVVARDDVVLATKAGMRTRGVAAVVDVSRGWLLDQLDASLRRLGTDHVDLWLVQAWSEEVDPAETLEALDRAVASGRARYAGVCNYTGWQTGWAAAHQDAWPGRASLACTEVEYSLLQRRVEAEVLPAARQLGLGVLAWAPLGRGVLTGKYRTGTPADSRAASPHLAAFVEPYLDARCRRVVEAVCTAADGLGVQPLEVALAWVRDRPGVAAPILGARTAAQLRGALPVEEITLPEQIAAALDDVSAASPGSAEAAAAKSVGEPARTR